MIQNFVLLTGSDDYRLGRRKRQFQQAFREKYPDGEIEYFETKSGFDGLSNAVLTPSLFGGRRLLFTEKFWTPDHFEEAEAAEFFAALDQSTDLTLVALEPDLDKRTKVSKWLLKNVKVEQFDPWSEGEILSWLVHEAKNNDVTLERKESMQLLNRVGENLHYLSQEIQKLSLMTENGKITSELIETHTLAHPKVVLWDFLADLSHKRAPAALQKFRDLRGAGEASHYVFAMLVREIGIHAQLRAGIDQGLSEADIARKTKIHPYVVKKTLPLSRRFSRDQIEAFYHHLRSMDYRLKTGKMSITTDDQLEFELAIEKFILQVCA